MLQREMEFARRGYAALSDAYRKGNIDDFEPVLAEFCDPKIVLVPAGVFPDSRMVQGWEAFLGLAAEQMQAFEKGSMWMEPLEFIDAGDRLVVPYRFGGRGRHTEIEVEFSFAHVVTMREGRAVRIDVYETKQEALEAAGLTEADISS
jgi:ketosteroid isomerase-like protein